MQNQGKREYYFHQSGENRSSTYQCYTAGYNDHQYRPFKVPVLYQLLYLMAHAPPSTVTAGLLPHGNAVTRAALHPARAALLNLCHSGITRGFAQAIHLHTFPRAGHCC